MTTGQREQYVSDGHELESVKRARTALAVGLLHLRQALAHRANRIEAGELVPDAEDVLKAVDRQVSRLLRRDAL